MAWLALVDGTITANGQTVALDVHEQSTAMIELTGTWVGTLQFEYTTDLSNANWYPLPAATIDTGTTATAETANGIWRAAVSAVYTLRVRASAWTSGTAAVHITASDAAGQGGTSSGGGGGGAMTVADGADVAQGTTTDAAYSSGAGTVIALLKGIWTRLRGGQATMANSLPVTVASDQGALPVLATAATATETNVTGSASSVTILAANTARKIAAVYNDSTALLYLKFGTTASATSHTVQVAAGGYYETGAVVYTGRIDGIWASAAGNARVTEVV